VAQDEPFTSRFLEMATISIPGNKDEKQDEIKSVIRKATEADLNTVRENEKQYPRIIKITNELISKYKLDMKLVDVSLTLDGVKVIINYVCEDRVDFRELVKDLASQLKLRIELRQIGIRDQAKIVGGIGFCGKECCCKKYLNDFDKVSIKMAKAQGLSLNPTKISGICGRLMCCLSYENEFYSEISAKMPKLNGKVKTKDGIGVAIYNNLLKQKVTVKIDNDGDIKVSEYDLSDIEILPRTPQPEPSKNVIKEAPKQNQENEPKDNKFNKKNKHKNKKR
jgi:cell fate regulator YaaT (PSP1 superfamily)